MNLLSLDFEGPETVANSRPGDTRPSIIREQNVGPFRAMQVPADGRTWVQSDSRECFCIIYPSLPGGYDFGIVRLMGAGIGNCLYAYFHAVVLAREANCRIITPTWSSVKVGPLLRRERSLRRYGAMFRAHPDEIHGFMKTARLIASWPRHKRVVIRVGQPVSAAPVG